MSRLYAERKKVHQQLDKATRRSAKAEARLDLEKQHLEQLRKKHHLSKEPEEESAEKPD
jgi:uncharacterized protein involved in exopolysaccharide biosynthesis